MYFTTEISLLQMKFLSLLDDFFPRNYIIPEKQAQVEIYGHVQTL